MMYRDPAAPFVPYQTKPPVVTLIAFSKPGSVASPGEIVEVSPAASTGEAKLALKRHDRGAVLALVGGV